MGLGVILVGLSNARYGEGYKVNEYVGNNCYDEECGG